MTADPIQLNQIRALHTADQASRQGESAQSAEQIREAARAFETLFMQQLFGEMRKANSVFSQGGMGMDFYQDMLDESVAEQAADQGGIGLARILEQAWGLAPEEGVQPGGESELAMLSTQGIDPFVLHRDGARPDLNAQGVVRPYALDRVFGHFHDVRSNGREHRGVDIGGVGENRGLGEPIVSMTRARVVRIGRPEDNPARYGTPDLRGGMTERGGRELPRSGYVPGYGQVNFFTEDYGTARTGTIVVTEVVGGPLDGHTIRYMHVGAVRPDLEVGDVLQPGEELGLMGGTAILDDSPHLHLDIADENGERVNPEPWLGLHDGQSLSEADVLELRAHAHGHGHGHEHE